MKVFISKKKLDVLVQERARQQVQVAEDRLEKVKAFVEDLSVLYPAIESENLYNHYGRYSSGDPLWQYDVDGVRKAVEAKQFLRNQARREEALARFECKPEPKPRAKKAG